MTEILFFLSFAFIVIIFISRHKIVDYCSDSLNIRIESEVIVYILTVLLIILIFVGMFHEDPKEKYSKISENYDQMRTVPEKKPHRYFDINTYD